MKKLSVILAVAALAFACTPEEEVTSAVTLTSDSEIYFDSDGGLQTVTFNSNLPWTARISDPHFVISPMEGEAGEGTIKVSALENDYDSAITSDLIIDGGNDVTAVVKCTLMQKDCIILQDTEYEFDSYAHTFEFVAVGNNDLKASCDADWITVNAVTTKDTWETKVTVEVAHNTGDERTASIIISGGKAKSEITIKQLALNPVLDINNTYPTTNAAGDPIQLDVTATVVYTVELQAEGDWISYTNDGDHYTFTFQPNTGYGARTAYFVLTTNEMFDEELDEAGEPTGNLLLHSIYAVITQEGLAYTQWRTEFFWDLYSYGGGFSCALDGDYLLVANSYTPGIFCFSKKDGSLVTTIDLPFAPTGVTNDYEGNIIVTTGGDYPLNEDWSLNTEAQLPLQVYAIKKGGLTAESPQLLLTYYDGFYGYGLNNARVAGDIYGDAALLMASAGYGESYIVGWQFKNGLPTKENEPGGYLAFYSSDPVYNSRNIIGMPLDPFTEDGIYGSGYATYDGYNYALMYNGYNGWFSTDFVLYQSWANAVMAMDVLEWNGKKILVADSMSFFAYADWDYDGYVDDYMPNYLFVLDISNPAQPVELACIDYYASVDNWQYGDTSDVVAEVVDGDLVVYIVNAAASHIQKMVLPAK